MGILFRKTQRGTQLISSAGATSKRAELIGKKRKVFLFGGKSDFTRKKSNGKVETKYGQMGKQSRKIS